MSARDLTEQEVIRRQHLDALREAGIEPYPAEEWATTHHAHEALDLYDAAAHDPETEGTEPIRVVIAGRMQTKRVMGKVAFFHVEDASGAIQVYARRDDLQEADAGGDGWYNKVFKKLLDPATGSA
ncbi:MAG: OB-fold nucleic acid binding domain-containing protein [Bacteroidota bacterium]